jgi:NodT family efflux transporter outer membrane factor (OMF) lipoprotein
MRVAALCLAAMATGGPTACDIGPTYHSPGIEAPRTWGPEPRDVPSRAVGGDVDVRWWKSFRDRELSLLVDRLVAQNLDLQNAAERVVQSVTLRRIAASQGLPHIEGQSIYNYNRASANGTASLFTPAPGAPLDYNFFQEGLHSSWELDLFGRVRRAVEARDADTLASEENRHGIAVVALAELAQSYLRLRGAQARLAIAQRSVKLADENISLVETRFSNGVATTLDLAQARSQKETIAATLPPLRAQEAQFINAVGLLLGEPPRALDGELRAPKALPDVPRHVPVGLPGTIVRLRPDVREAEARLHAAVAETGVAVADFYPDLTLMGDVNVQSLHLANLFTPGSIAFTVGPNLSIPIFEGGRLSGNLELRESQQREAAITFQNTVLRAWREVDDALTDYAEAQRRRAAIARAVDQNRIALNAARERYKEGVVDFLNVNAALSQLLESENELADNDTLIASDLVNLYRALGGGWQIADRPRLVEEHPPERVMPGAYHSGGRDCYVPIPNCQP